MWWLALLATTLLVVGATCARARRRAQRLLGDQVRAVLAESHAGKPSSVAPTDAESALAPLAAEDVVVEQALTSAHAGRTKHVFRLRGDVDAVRRAVRRRCGGVVDVVTDGGAVYGRHGDECWSMQPVDARTCFVVRVTAGAEIRWTNVLHEDWIDVERAAVQEDRRLPMRLRATLAVDFDRVVAFFTEGEALADANVLRQVVLSKDATSLTLFLQFKGLWPVCGPRHQATRYDVERGPGRVVMRGESTADHGERPAPSSVAVDKTSTITIERASNGTLVVVVERADAKLPTKTVPDWACALLAKQLRSRLAAVEAHLKTGKKND